MVKQANQLVVVQSYAFRREKDQPFTPEDQWRYVKPGSAGILACQTQAGNSLALPGRFGYFLTYRHCLEGVTLNSADLKNFASNELIHRFS